MMHGHTYIKSMVKFKYDPVYSLPLVPVESEVQLHYSEGLRRDSLNAVYKRKMSPWKSVKPRAFNRPVVTLPTE